MILKKYNNKKFICKISIRKIISSKYKYYRGIK